MSEISPERESAETSEELTQFLELELKVTRTMLDLAHTENLEPRDSRGLQQALKNAQKALTTVFDFLPRLGQSAVAEEIKRTALGLQAELVSLTQSREPKDY